MCGLIYLVLDLNQVFKGQLAVKSVNTPSWGMSSSNIKVLIKDVVLIKARNPNQETEGTSPPFLELLCKV